MRLGNVEFHIVSDGEFWVDGGAAFGLVPKILWSRVITPDDLNRIPMALNCLLIIADGQRILVDTGYGDKLSPKERDIFRIQGEKRLLGSLARLGLAPTDIDIVINTHLHADHCGGNTVWQDGQPVPTFPNAEYWIQRLEWADALHPGVGYDDGPGGNAEHVRDEAFRFLLLGRWLGGGFSHVCRVGRGEENSLVGAIGGPP